MDIISSLYTEDDLGNSCDPSPSFSQQSQEVSIIPRLSSAPVVALVPKSHPQLIKQNQHELMYNPKAEVVLAPLHGPAHPFKFNAPAPGAKLAGMGHIEETNLEAWTFDEQFQTYQRSGYAVDSSTNAIIGDIQKYYDQNGETAQTAKGK